MTLFFETWVPLALLGGLILAVAGPLATLTKKKSSIATAVVAIGLIVLSVLLDVLIVTDAEAIKAALKGAVDQLEANDPDATLEFISEEAPETRRLTRFGAEHYHVDYAAVRDLEIYVNTLSTPPTATATFRGIGSGRAVAGDFPGVGGGVQLDIVVPFRKEGDRWMIYEPVQYDFHDSSEPIERPPGSYETEP